MKGGSVEKVQYREEPNTQKVKNYRMLRLEKLQATAFAGVPKITELLSLAAEEASVS